MLLLIQLTQHLQQSNHQYQQTGFLKMPYKKCLGLENISILMLPSAPGSGIEVI